MLQDGSRGISSDSLTLPRSLTAYETWGFGLTGHVLWISSVPAIHAALKTSAIWVWLPAVVFGMVLNYQVKRLGQAFSTVAGGTPNYTTHLLKRYPFVASYAAIGYFFGWITALPINAIVLTDLIEVDLHAVGLQCPPLLLRSGIIVLSFALAFSGTRALSLLHTFLIVPAFGLIALFAIVGVGWLATDPTSPGLFSAPIDLPNFQAWSKWFFYVSYATYACESASAFVVDSHQPQTTLKSLGGAAWLMPIPFLMGSWVVAQLATDNPLKNDAFLTFAAAAQPFLGGSTAIVVTFLLVAACLLSVATAVSNTPRIVYQLAIDGYLAPVFAAVSRRGVLGAALALVLILNLFCLLWGDVPELLVVGNVGYFIGIMATHAGVWLQRKDSSTLLPELAIGLFGLEAIVLVVGGLSWNRQDFAIGLMIPLAIMGIDWIIRRIPLAAFQLETWMAGYQRQTPMLIDSIGLQVTTLIVLLCGAVTAGWWFGSLSTTAIVQAHSLLLVLLLSVAFIGIAIAGWTTLPQMLVLTEARETAEQSLLKQQQIEADLRKSETALRQQTIELEAALLYVQQTQSKLVQSEKMSSLGQLVAGVAHEINNPVNFIYGNLEHAEAYLQDLLKLINLYQEQYPPHPVIAAIVDEIELDFVAEDLPKLMDSMRIGADRIREIVQSLRTFSRLDEAVCKSVDVHEGIDSTLMILQHRLKATQARCEIRVQKQYAALPFVECYAGQLNQVFMNILSNAIDAIEDAIANNHFSKSEVPMIRIQTELTPNQTVQIRIANDGLEIPEAVQARLFEPFFTTKPVGKGTGLGLSISYEVVTGRHCGSLTCHSSPEIGVEFAIEIPIKQNQQQAES